MNTEEQFKNVVAKFKMPNRMSLPNSYFSSNSLPGSQNFAQKKLRKLQKILTPNEFNYFTNNFRGMQLNTKTGLPIGGRGTARKMRRKRKKMSLNKTRKCGKNKKRKKKKSKK